MAKKLTAKVLHSRYEALFEASQHLYMNWTDDQVEYEQGVIMAKWLHAQSLKWLALAEEAQKALPLSNGTKSMAELEMEAKALYGSSNAMNLPPDKNSGQG